MMRGTTNIDPLVYCLVITFNADNIVEPLTKETSAKTVKNNLPLLKGNIDIMSVTDTEYLTSSLYFVNPRLAQSTQLVPSRDLPMPPLGRYRK